MKSEREREKEKDESGNIENNSHPRIQPPLPLPQNKDAISKLFSINSIKLKIII